MLDASTLLPLLLDYGEELLSVATRVELYVVDLTLYEVGNSLWKLVTLLNSLELRDAEDIVYILKSLVKKEVVRVVRFDELDLYKVLGLAVGERLTFYDASYIVASEAVGAVLVTEDRELREKARKYINTMGYSEFRERLAK